MPSFRPKKDRDGFRSNMHGIEFGKYYLSHLDLNRDIDIIRRGYKRNGLRYLLDFGGVYLLYQLF